MPTHALSSSVLPSAWTVRRDALMAVARVESGTGGFDGCLEALVAE